MKNFGVQLLNSLRSETDESGILIFYQVVLIFGQKHEPLLQDFNER